MTSEQAVIATKIGCEQLHRSASSNSINTSALSHPVSQEEATSARMMSNHGDRRSHPLETATVRIGGYDDDHETIARTKTRSRLQRYRVGQPLAKWFRAEMSWFPGTVESFNRDKHLYHVRYVDGDSDDNSEGQIQRCIKTMKQRYTQEEIEAFSIPQREDCSDWWEARDVKTSETDADSENEHAKPVSRAVTRKRSSSVARIVSDRRDRRSPSQGTVAVRLGGDEDDESISRRKTHHQQKYQVGQPLAKWFLEENSWFPGKVESFDGHHYHVRYVDGDSDDNSEGQIQRCIKTMKQRYTKEEIEVFSVPQREECLGWWEAPNVNSNDANSENVDDKPVPRAVARKRSSSKAGQRPKHSATKPKKRRAKNGTIWRESGASGCPKCRFKGCRRCYEASMTSVARRKHKIKRRKVNGKSTIVNHRGTHRSDKAFRSSHNRPTGRRSQGVAAKKSRDGDGVASNQQLTPPAFTMFGTLALQEMILRPTSADSHTARRTLAYRIFGERLAPPIVIEGTFDQLVGKGAFPKVTPTIRHSGKVFEILAAKHSRIKEMGFGYRKRNRHKITFWYVCRKSRGMTLQRELERLGAFQRLASPAKVKARLELLFTPAIHRNITPNEEEGQHGKFLIDDDLSDDYEIIDDNGSHEGCGYIPRHLIEAKIGKNSVGQRTFAFQVRIVSPRLGVFKGMLMEKPGIDKIQLPRESMLKVPPSEQSSAWKDDMVKILVKGRFPSKLNFSLGKVWHSEDDDLEAWAKFLQKQHTEHAKALQLSDMVIDVLSDCGVPSDVLETYQEELLDSDSERVLGHACVVGVADPTDCIPEGHVFIPGWKLQDKVFVTRFPCMSAEDGRVLPSVISKPRNMPNEKWDFLQSLAFGCIIFGHSTSTAGRASLPSRIAGGDLDGDLYFIMRDQEVLDHLEMSTEEEIWGEYHSDEECRDEKVESEVTTEGPKMKKSTWFKKTQSCLVDYKAVVEIHCLEGTLHNAAKAEREKAKDPSINAKDRAVHEDAGRCLGAAYKQSLDLMKHGGQIGLPLRHWELLSEHFHKYLTDIMDYDNAMSC